MKTEIRTYTPADKEQVMSLIRLNIPHYFAPEEEDDFSDYLDHKRDLYYVLLCGDAIIGCGGINFDEEEAVGKISWDIIHPGYQRRGLGTLLLQYRMDKLKSIESIRKITVRTSQFVYPFYQKNGFVLLKTEKDFSAKGFDLYQMEYITKCSTHITDRKHNMQDLDTFLPTANRKSIIMNKEEIYDCLNSFRIPHEVTEHKAVYTMAELIDVVFPYPESLAKNLFVRDDKKHNYYLITVKGNKRINLKEFRRNNGTRPLSFADESDLMSVLALAPGSVTPLGLLNDKDCKAQLYLDEEFLNALEIIGIHPNDNTATVWLHTKDLIRLLREQGHNVHIIKI